MNAQERTYAESSDERGLIAEYLGLRGVSREVAVALVTGILPRLSCVDVEAYQREGNALELLDRSAHVAWLVDGETGALRGAQLLDEGSQYQEVNATLSRDSSGAPRRVILSIVEPVTATVSIDLTRVILDPRLDDRLFSVEVPAGYERE